MMNDLAKLRMWQGQPKATIPLYLSVEHGGDRHDDDTLEHEVQLFVVDAAEATLTLAIVQSDFYKNPRVLRYERVASLGLRADVLDQLMVKAFKTLAHHMIEHDGDAVEMWVSDAVAWLDRRLSATDITEVVAALAPHVRLGRTVRDMVCVRID